MKKSELRRIIKEEISKLFEQEISQEAKDEVVALLKSFNGKEIPDKEIHAVADKYKVSPHDLERWIYSLASEHVSEAAEKNDISAGIEIEKEHLPTINKIKQYVKDNKKFPENNLIYQWISIDHIKEFPTYYDELKKMEDKLKGKSND